MLWVLWDIFLPVLAAFLAGLFVGWLFWRWRRSRIDADTLSALRRNNTRLKNDADNLRARNAELSDRLQIASVSAGTARASNGNTAAEGTELVAARNRIETLSSELKSSRVEINRLRDNSDRVLSEDTADKGQVNRVRDLEARLQGAHRRIADLEQASRGKHTQTGLTTDRTDLSEAISVRDQMIETLRRSLAQYGDTQDRDMLIADLQLRDNKISALEAMLDKANRRS